MTQRSVGAFAWLRRAVRFFDPRTRRAPFGYLPPGLAGAPGFVVGDDALALARSAVPDGRQVVMKMRLAADGSAVVRMTEATSAGPRWSGARSWSEPAGIESSSARSSNSVARPAVSRRNSGRTLAAGGPIWEPEKSATP